MDECVPDLAFLKEGVRGKGVIVEVYTNKGSVRRKSEDEKVGTVFNKRVEKEGEKERRK